MIWVTIGKTILSSLASMGMALLTETFLKDIVVMGLEWVAHKTKTVKDDQLVAAVKHAWGLGPAPEGDSDGK